MKGEWNFKTGAIIASVLTGIALVFRFNGLSESEKLSPLAAFMAYVFFWTFCFIIFSYTKKSKK